MSKSGGIGPSRPGKRKLRKITTNIPEEDFEAIKEFTQDGSKDAEHYRAAIREYVRMEKLKRKGRG